MPEHIPRTVNLEELDIWIIRKTAVVKGLGEKGFSAALRLIVREWAADHGELLRKPSGNPARDGSHKPRLFFVPRPGEPDLVAPEPDCVESENPGAASLGCEDPGFDLLENSLLPPRSLIARALSAIRRSLQR